jgi:hypothetical protein
MLNETCDIMLSGGCSMQVHVARPGLQWSIPALSSLMKATGVFDDAIMKIMPADRKMNPWARSSFRDIPPGLMAEAPIKKAFDEVPTRTWRPLFDIFDKVRTNADVLSTLGNKPSVSMNFAALDITGTVEFRRPPAVKTATEAQKWIAFTVAFVCAALEPDWHHSWSSRKYHASVEDLQAFVGRGIKLLGWQPEILDPQTLVEDKSRPKKFKWFKAEEVRAKLSEVENKSAFGPEV